MRRLVPTLTLALLALAAPAAIAQTAPSQDRIDGAREEVSRLEDRAADAATRVTRAEERLAEVDARLDAARTALDEAETVAEDARRAAEASQVAAGRAQRRLDASRTELERNDRELGKVARDSYIRGPATTSPTLAVLGSMSATRGGPQQLADTLHVVGRILGDRAEVVERSRTLVTQTQQLAREAAAADALAQQELATAAAARDEAGRRHADMLAVLEEASAAADEARQARDEATVQLAAAEEQLATLEERKRAAEEAERKRREAARRAAQRRELGGGLVRVGGITVHESIADDVQALLVAARADGIVLGGYGYRSPETTIRLRRVNGCPDVYTSPASSCRVPTARPGESMHERGLAIDFTYQGSTICYPNAPSRCHGNAAFDWLSANAHRYGLRVLSTEAWHWSVNGS